MAETNQILKEQGVACYQAGKLAEAIAAFRGSLESNPAQADVHAILGACLIHSRDINGAMEECRKAIALDANLAAAHNNLGACLRYLGRHEEAVLACWRAMELRPDYAQALTNLGAALAELGEVDKATALHLRALQLEPEMREAHWNLAISSLRAGDLVWGFAEYEWRLKGPGAVLAPGFSQPSWDGADLRGKTILLHGEQGIGDILQFVRYVPLVADQGGRIVLVCHAELCRLLREMPLVAEVVPFGAAPPAFDVYCPLMSLARIFGTTIQSIPSKVPYLRASQVLAKRWGERLGNSKGKRRVGLVWAGRADYKDDQTRSIRLNDLAPLASADVEFHSLQKGAASQQVKQPPSGLSVIDHADDLRDFADTAALVEKLDLIISVDTAVAHLAGAMGKPVWTLLPTPADWRWMLRRTDSPWYPTMILYRQKTPGDWKSVIGRIAQELMTG
jgi:hypothetical protein